MKRLLAVIGMASPLWFVWFWAFLDVEGYWPETSQYSWMLAGTMLIGWCLTLVVSHACMDWWRK